MEQVPSYIDKIMCKYSFDKTETEYIENCLLELYKTKKLIGEDIKYWIKSFTDAVHANRFYIDVICEQDLTKYYHRYYRTKKNIRPAIPYMQPRTFHVFGQIHHCDVAIQLRHIRFQPCQKC